MSSYEKGNVWLGEAGKLLIQYTKYDIPALKKHIKQKEKVLDDLEKKISDYNRLIGETQVKNRDSMVDLGIPEDTPLNDKILRDSIRSMAHDELPPRLRSLLDALKSDDLYDAMAHYGSFSLYVLEKSTITNVQALSNMLQTKLPSLSLVRMKGMFQLPTDNNLSKFSDGIIHI